MDDARPQGSPNDISGVFALPEYNRAASQFISRAIRALTRSKDPLLRQTREVYTELVPTHRVTTDTGEVVEAKPIAVQMEFGVDIPETIRGDFTSLYVGLDSAADQAIKTLVPGMFEYIDRVSAAVGTTIDADGKPLSHELLLKVFETMDIEFDADGNPRLSIVAPPDVARQIAALPAPTPAQEQALNELIERKRKEADARKRRRKLS